MKLRLLAPVLLAAALAGCGSTPHHATSQPVVKVPVHTPKAAVVTAKVVNQHACDLRDYNLACPLPIASVATITRGVDPVLQGVDFGWSCPVSAARNFGASYLSYDTGKDWSAACVRLFHSQGKGTVAVFEAGASDATRGYSLGYSQAKRAASELAALGAPSNQPFTMAIDCDCAGSSLVGYFQGANAAEPGRVNAYGGYYQLAYLYGRHLVGHLNWQTYAWSGGRWLSASIAPLEQYLNSSRVDYDRAIAPNYGQWPAPVVVNTPRVPNCSVSMCYYRFSTTKYVNHKGVWCSKGCVERSIAKDYQAKRPNWRKYHAVLVEDRYRMQWLSRRLRWLIANSSVAQNHKQNRYSRRGYFDAAGFRAWYKTNLNAYLACGC